jgi:hypothetical protein
MDLNQGVPYNSVQEAEDAISAKKLSEFKSTLPPAIQDRIHSLDDWQSYMETGKTYEDQVAEMIETTQTLSDWKQKIPQLEQALQYYNSQWEAENKKEDGFLTSGPRRNQHLLDDYDMKRNAILGMIGDIRSGKVPTNETPGILTGDYSLQPVQPTTTLTTTQPQRYGPGSSSNSRQYGPGLRG